MKSKKKLTNTSTKRNKRQPKSVKNVESPEVFPVSEVGTNVSVKNTLKKLNPDAYKHRDDKNYNKKIAEIRKSQEQFYDNVVMTSVFLNVFSGNPDDFHLLLGDDIIKKYKFDESWDNPEWVWESIDEMACDMTSGAEYFKVVGNGLFITLHLSTKKKSMSRDYIIREFSRYMGGEWSI